jgi:hypothetical protein
LIVGGNEKTRISTGFLGSWLILLQEVFFILIHAPHGALQYGQPDSRCSVKLKIDNRSWKCAMKKAIPRTSPKSIVF